MLDMILYLVLYAKGGSDGIAFADLLFNKRIEQNPEKILILFRYSTTKSTDGNHYHIDRRLQVEF